MGAEGQGLKLHRCGAAELLSGQREPTQETGPGPELF